MCGKLDPREKKRKENRREQNKHGRMQNLVASTRDPILILRKCVFYPQPIFFFLASFLFSSFLSFFKPSSFQSLPRIPTISSSPSYNLFNIRSSQILQRDPNISASRSDAAIQVQNKDFTMAGNKKIFFFFFLSFFCSFGSRRLALKYKLSQSARLFPAH